MCLVRQEADSVLLQGERVGRDLIDKELVLIEVLKRRNPLKWMRLVTHPHLHVQDGYGDFEVVFRELNRILVRGAHAWAFLFLAEDKVQVNSAITRAVVVPLQAQTLRRHTLYI